MKKINGSENRIESPEKSNIPSVVKQQQHQHQQQIQTSHHLSLKPSTRKYPQKIKSTTNLTKKKVILNKKLPLQKSKINNGINIKNGKNDIFLNKLNKQRLLFTKYSSSSSSTTKKICQMQKSIQELKAANKDIKYENEYLRKAALRSMTNFICAKELQEELQLSVNKCKELELLLTQKNLIIEKYQYLLKEISGNVNIMMKELENENTNKKDNENDNILQKQLKKLSKIQQKSERFAMNSKSINNYIVNKLQKNNENNSFSSSSDTLVDADLSFETSTVTNSQEPRNIDANLQPVKPIQLNISSTVSSFDGSLLIENHCLSCNNEDSEEESNEYINITLPSDDMSEIIITTSDIQNNSDESSEHISQSKEFQHGLHELDQKIYKAKMLLESFKI